MSFGNVLHEYYMEFKMDDDTRLAGHFLLSLSLFDAGCVFVLIIFHPLPFPAMLLAIIGIDFVVVGLLGQVANMLARFLK